MTWWIIMFYLIGCCTSGYYVGMLLGWLIVKILNKLSKH